MFVKAIPYRFKNLVIFLSTTVLIITSCKIGVKDDNTTIIGEDGYNHIGSEVIGTAGGEINLDSIIVTIPSNTFDDNTEINIFVGQENDGFDEYASSSLYQISGLPSTINKPIRLSLKYHGTIEGDNLVAIGEMGYAVSLDSLLYSYHAESATDSAGYLVYELPAYSNLAKLTLSREGSLSRSINTLVLNSYQKLPTAEGNFMLDFPLRNRAEAIEMGKHFETAYTTCLAMGFTYPFREWPVNVMAKAMTKIGFYSYENSNPIDKATVTDQELRNLINRGNFQISIETLNKPILPFVCGHEFLHLVQNLYEFSSPNIEPEQSWLMEATAVWIQEKYTRSFDYVQSQITKREMYPFDGWQYKDRGYTGQGYGLSVIIKEVANKYGDDAIVEIFKKIQAGTLPSDAVDPVDAVLSVLEEPVSEFWHRTLGNYVLGHYYDNLVNFEFLDDPNNYSDTFTINAALVTQSRLKQYHDLSGKLFKVVPPADLSSLDKIPLLFTISDPVNCGIMICKYKKGSEIDIIGDILGGSGQITIGDVKPLFEAGYELVVMVSNSTHDKNANYQGTNTIELTIEIKEPENQIEYLVFDFTLDEAETKTTFSTGAESYGKRIRHGLTSKCGESTFSDNVYTTIFNGNNFDWCNSITGNLIVSFIDEPKSVNVHAEWSVIGGDWTGNYAVDYEGIPYDGHPGSNSDLYFESGSMISRIDVSQYDIVSTNSTKELLNTNCGNDAEIGVWVYYLE